MADSVIYPSISCRFATTKGTTVHMTSPSLLKVDTYMQLQFCSLNRKSAFEKARQTSKSVSSSNFWQHTNRNISFLTYLDFRTPYSLTETDGNIGIVSKPSIPSLLVSVSVSIEAFFESRYQSRYRSRGLCIFCKLWVEFLLSKVSVSVSVPGHFPGISISIGLD